MLNANYKNTRFMGHEITRGQIVCGRKQLCSDTGISEQSIRSCLERLKSTSEITSKSTNKFTIITLCNYENYQSDILEINQQNHQQLTSDQPATNQQLTTSKEGKKEKKEKKVKNILHSFENSPFFKYELFRKELPEWSEGECLDYHQRAVDYSGANGGKYLNWVLAVKQWKRKDNKNVGQERMGIL